MTDKTRLDAAIRIARDGGALALDYFRKLDTLKIEDKGHQDFVTIADQNVETRVRDLIQQAYPDDGIVGEEHAPKPSTTGYTWVIDPIDGTTNFINAIPQWCVIISVVRDDQTVVGVTYDPVHDDMYAALRGSGATLNDRPLICPADTTLTRGTVATGMNNRITAEGAVRVVEGIIAKGSVFHRNASGGLSLAYVSAGRLLGYVEEHMNAWDCLAGHLLIAEAGGAVEDWSADAVIRDGTAVVAGSKGIFDELQQIARDAFSREG